MTFSRMRSLAQNEMSLKNTEEKKISIQFSNEIKSSQYNFIKLPLELINYLDINELLQQQNVIFRRLLSALNIDRRHFSGSHAIARPKFSRRVNSNTPQNFILPGLDKQLLSVQKHPVEKPVNAGTSIYKFLLIELQETLGSHFVFDGAILM